MMLVVRWKASLMLQGRPSFLLLSQDVLFNHVAGALSPLIHCSLHSIALCAFIQSANRFPFMELLLLASLFFLSAPSPPSHLLLLLSS